MAGTSVCDVTRDIGPQLTRELEKAAAVSGFLLGVPKSLGKSREDVT